MSSCWQTVNRNLMMKNIVAINIGFSKLSAPFPSVFGYTILPLEVEPKYARALGLCIVPQRSLGRSRQTIRCTYEPKSSTGCNIFVDFPRNKYNFLLKDKHDTFCTAVCGVLANIVVSFLASRHRCTLLMSRALYPQWQPTQPRSNLKRHDDN